MSEKGLTGNPKTGKCESINEYKTFEKDAECKDTVGSFMCVCKGGKFLDDTGMNCKTKSRFFNVLISSSSARS